MSFSNRSSSSKPRIKDIKLNSLLEVTKAINNNFSTDQLLKIFEFVLKNQLNIGKIVLYSYDNGWKCLISHGTGEEFNHIDVERDLLHIKEISTIDFANESKNKSSEIIIPVYHKSNPLAYVLIGDLNENKLEVSAAIKHLPFIQTLANIIMVAIENKKLAKENIRQAAIRKELELASEMQNMLFPSKLPDDDQLSMHAVYLPHQQVGGDYYDFIRLNENEIAFCMADVSGKGVPAALLMSNFQANLRILFNHTSSLTELVKELNTKVMESAKGEKFITMIIAKYNLVTRTLNYINAGHNPPILASGKFSSLLKIGCTGLGMFDELIKVKEGIVNINPDSILLCYTDGVVELENEQGDDFGTEKLKTLILDSNNLHVKDLNNKVIQTITTFKGKMPYIDDIALFTCRFH